jgi:hypothetical protein
VVYREIERLNQQPGRTRHLHHPRIPEELPEIAAYSGNRRGFRGTQVGQQNTN